MLLQSLIYSFQADTRDLDKGIKSAEKGSDDLTDALKRSENQSKKTSQTLGMFAKAAIGWLGAAASAGKVMGMAIQRAGEIDALDTLSLQLGTSITKTDALARSIVGIGGSTEQAQSDLGSLADALKERGQKPLEGMLQLSDRLAGMSYDRATRELKEYGITEKSTVELMRKGSGEIQRMIKHQERNGAITQEAADKARSFNQSLNGLKQVSSDAANSFAQFLMPVLTKVIDFLAMAGKWASENKTFVIAFFAGVAGIVTAMFLPAMLSAAAATIAATWPFIAIGAAIGAAAAAFALIYDDIMTFIDGGESMIGMVLEKFPVIGEVVTWLWETMKLAFGSIVGLGESLLAGMSGMADGIIGVFQWLWSMVKKYLDFVGGAINKVKGAVGWVAGKFGIGDSSIDVNAQSKVTTTANNQDGGIDFASPPKTQQEGAAFDVGTLVKAQREIKAADDNPAASMTTGAIRNAATGNQVEQNLAIGEITIETQATDAQGMASSTRSELQDQLQRMQANNATAITR